MKREPVDDHREERAEPYELRPEEPEAPLPEPQHTSSPEVETEVGDEPSSQPLADDLSQLHTVSHPRLGAKPARGPGTSRLGLIAILVGIIAGGLIYFPIPRIDPVGLAGVGAGIGLLAMAIRRSGVGVPLFGVIICGIAVGMGLYNKSAKLPGTPAGWVNQQIDHLAAVRQQAPLAPRSSTPAAGTPSASGRSSTPGGEGVGAGTIFDGQASNAPARPRSHNLIPSEGDPDAPGTAAIGQSPRDDAAAPVMPFGAALAAREAAQHKLADARTAVMARLAKDQEYVAAKGQVDAADAQVQKLKQSYDAFAAPLMQAAQEKLEAQQKLTALTDAAMKNDSAVLAAQQELADVELKLRPSDERIGH